MSAHKARTICGKKSRIRNRFIADQRLRYILLIRELPPRQPSWLDRQTKPEPSARRPRHLAAAVEHARLVL